MSKPKLNEVIGINVKELAANLVELHDSFDKEDNEVLRLLQLHLMAAVGRKLIGIEVHKKRLVKIHEERIK